MSYIISYILYSICAQESKALLAEGCERKVVAPSAFVISLGLEPDANGEGSAYGPQSTLLSFEDYYP